MGIIMQSNRNNMDLSIEIEHKVLMNSIRNSNWREYSLIYNDMPETDPDITRIFNDFLSLEQVEGLIAECKSEIDASKANRSDGDELKRKWIKKVAAKAIILSLIVTIGILSANPFVSAIVSLGIIVIPQV